jgi:hypothetical protein
MWVGTGTKKREERPGIFRLKKGRRKIEWSRERNVGWDRNKKERGETWEERENKGNNK